MSNEGNEALRAPECDREFLQTVWDGLAAKPKRIPPKYFYDARGSELFEAICRLPEYYPTRTERAILSRHAEAIAREVGPDAQLIEPGAGSCEKVRLLLEALRPAAYVPVEICAELVEAAAAQLRRAYPWLRVEPRSGDFTRLEGLLDGLARGRPVVFFPGSTVGNLEPEEAVGFLARLAAVVGPGGHLIIGVDLKKDPGVLAAAYNDAAGTTAAFNRNLLVRINRELDGDFDPGAFEHRARYDGRQGRVEMHLVSRRAQTVRVAGRAFPFAAGESIHTENSYKYGLAEFAELAARAGLRQERYWADERGWFSVQLLRAVRG